MKKRPDPDRLTGERQTCKEENNTSLTQFFPQKIEKQSTPPNLFHEANIIIYENLTKVLQHNNPS